MAEWGYRPNIYVGHTSTPAQIMEEVLAVMVREKMITVSGAIGERVLAKVREYDEQFMAETVNADG